jgi:hypothetical protein
MTTNNAPRSTDERSIRLTLADPANVKVTTWWQTSFVPPDPKSDSLLLFDDRLASGDRAVRVPDLVPLDEADVRRRGTELRIGDRSGSTSSTTRPPVSIEQDAVARMFFTNCTSDP